MWICWHPAGDLLASRETGRFFKTMAMKQASSSGWWLKLAVAYLIIAVIVFFAALETGFLSEDYCILLLMKERGSFALLPSEHGIFMPMAFLFFNALFPVFGLLAWPYHAVFGLMHVANALLVAACMRRLADLFCPGFKQQSWLASLQDLYFLFFHIKRRLLPGSRRGRTRCPCFAQCGASCFF